MLVFEEKETPVVLNEAEKREEELVLTIIESLDEEDLQLDLFRD